MDKLEKHFKKSLGKRELHPSESAWNKIESQLGGSKKSKPVFSRIWYAVAAVFVGAILVTSIYLDSRIKPNEIQLVDTENQNQSKEEKENQIVFDKELESTQDKLEEKLVEVKQKFVPKKETEERIVFEKPQKPVLSDGLPEREQHIIDQKVNEVFAKVALLKNNNEAVTNAEVDSLLRAAQNEILADKIFEENGSVDALALLTEVEDELEQTFRDRVFEALKDGYTKLKTAVADRNN